MARNALVANTTIDSAMKFAAQCIVNGLIGALGRCVRNHVVTGVKLGDVKYFCDGRVEAKSALAIMLNINDATSSAAQWIVR